MKPFEKWEHEELEYRFGISRNDSISALQNWIDSNVQPSDFERDTLESLRQELSLFVGSWNEDELKFFFISTLINLVRFKGEGYSTFTQRTIEAEIDGEKMRGRVELVVARGKQKPWQPFFFVHEYKPRSKDSRDPLGQLLAAMLVSQEINEVNIPILGCYVVGAEWTFVVLQEKEYGLSRDFLVSRSDDILQVFSILKQAKILIEENLKNLPMPTYKS
jgi:hypothetical protein